MEWNANIKLSRRPGAGNSGFGLRNEWGEEECKDNWVSTDDKTKETESSFFFFAKRFKFCCKLFFNLKFWPSISFL